MMTDTLTPVAAPSTELESGGPPTSSHRWEDNGSSVTVYDVELFAEYDGEADKEVTREHLDTIADVTNRMMLRGRHPTIVIGHEKHTADASERPAVGYVSGPVRVAIASTGRYTIFGNLVFNSYQFHAAIRPGDFPRRSIERVTNGDDATPVDWIAQVALLGKSLPAHDLPDVRFYSREDEMAQDAPKTEEHERTAPMTFDELIDMIGNLDDDQKAKLSAALGMSPDSDDTDDSENDEKTEDSTSGAETDDNSVDARIVMLTAQVGQLEAQRERAIVEREIEAIQTEGYSIDVGDEVEIALAIPADKRTDHYSRIRKHYKRDERAQLAEASNMTAKIASAASVATAAATNPDNATKVYSRGFELMAENPTLTERQAFAKAATELGIDLTK